MNQISEIGALPQQESRQPLFARRADDKIGIGLAGSVEVTVDAVDGDGVHEVVAG